MALKFFLIYLGILFSGAFVFWMLIRQFAAAFAAQGKKPLIYGIVSALLCGGLLFGATYLTHDLFVVFWVFTAIFLMSGIVHMALMHKKFYATREDNFTRLFIGELIFALSVVLLTLLVFSALEYFIRDKDFMFYPMLTGALFFFIPFLFLHLFNAAFRIPHAVFTTWQYPVGRPVDPPEDNENERLLVIAFEIGKKPADPKKTTFRARAPEEIRLGDLFYHFINDYNELQSETPIQYTDAASLPYEWWFRIKPRWYQRQRIIDPFATIRNNNISENAVIICERIDKSLNAEEL